MLPYLKDIDQYDLMQPALTDADLPPSITDLLATRCAELEKMDDQRELDNENAQRNSIN